MSTLFLQSQFTWECFLAGNISYHCIHPMTTDFQDSKKVKLESKVCSLLLHSFPQFYAIDKQADILT